MQKQWSYDLHQRPEYPGSLLAENLIVVPERYHWLTRLDPLTGTRLWSIQWRSEYGSLCATRTSLVHCVKESIVQVLDHTSGAALWQRDVSPDHQRDIHLAASDSIIIAYDWRGEVPIQALDAQSGTLRWSYSPNFNRTAIQIAPWGITVGHTPWEREKPGELPHLLILDPSTGTPHTRIDLPPDLRQGRLHAWGTRMIITTAAGQIYTADPASESALSLLGNIAEGIQTATIVGDLLIVYDKERQMRCFCLSSANQRWSIRVEHHDMRRLPVVRMGEDIILGSSQGNLYVIDHAGQLTQQHHVERRIMTNLIQSARNTIIFGTKGAIVAYDVQRREENQTSLAGPGEEHDSAQ